MTFDRAYDAFHQTGILICTRIPGPDNQPMLVAGVATLEELDDRFLRSFAAGMGSR